MMGYFGVSTALQVHNAIMTRISFSVYFISEFYSMEALKRKLYCRPGANPKNWDINALLPMSTRFSQLQYATHETYTRCTLLQLIIFDVPIF